MAELTVSEALAKACDLWRKSPTKGAMARDTAGEEVEPTSKDAVRWCAIGALWHVVGSKIDPASDLGGRLIDDAVRLLSMSVKGEQKPFGSNRSWVRVVSLADDCNMLTVEHWELAADMAKQEERGEL